MTNTTIGTNGKWFVFAAGVVTGVLPSFGAFTAWVWSGPESTDAYYASSTLHAVAPQPSYSAAIVVISLVLVAVVLITIVRFVRIKCRR